MFRFDSDSEKIASQETLAYIHKYIIVYKRHVSVPMEILTDKPWHVFAENFDLGESMVGLKHISTKRLISHPEDDHV